MATFQSTAGHSSYQAPHRVQEIAHRDDMRGDIREDLEEAFSPLRLSIQPSGLTTELKNLDVLVGRHSEADIRLPLPDVSRRHCRFVFRQGKWWVHDLDSLNGVFVNGEKVRQVDLHHRDVIRVGGYTLEVDLRCTPATVALPTSISGSARDPLCSIAEAMRR